MNNTKRLLIAGLLLLILGVVAGNVSAQNKAPAAQDQAAAQKAAELWRTQTFVIGMGEVEGAQLRRLKVSGSATCYFWKDSVSCVRD